MKERRRCRRSSFEYRDDRNRNLLKVFMRELGRVNGESLDDVLQRTVDSPARRFWVSEERALRVVSAMRRHPLPAYCHPLKREMFEEISRRSQALAVRHPEWPFSRCVYHVVNREAPKFYLSPDRAHVIICEERRRCKREQMMRFRRLISA
jgi:hypothetical protein